MGELAKSFELKSFTESVEAMYFGFGAGNGRYDPTPGEKVCLMYNQTASRRPRGELTGVVGKFRTKESKLTCNCLQDPNLTFRREYDTAHCPTVII